jgi:hypothetical protein
MNTCSNISFATTRRGFLQSTSAGFGWLAFSALNGWQLQAEQKAGYVNPLAPKKPHHAPNAKRVIFLYMQGGPSHLDTFDWKPEIAHREGGPSGAILGSRFKFKPRGKSGIMISEAFPELSNHADELCLLNGCTTRTPSHQQATVALHTGNEMFVRPSMGAWTVYGLGTEAQDLPGFITIDPPHDQGGAMNYGSAFLPATYQGTRISGGQRGLPNLEPLLSYENQRTQVDFMQKLNRRLLSQHDPSNPELEGVIQSMEMACQMQTSVPNVLDLSKEPDSMNALYGLDNSATERFGTQCLTARRLAEKGVRFIQITHTGWDHHNNLRQNLGGRAESIDKPIAGLITDLKQRDMLKDTLILWGGEFGRTPNDDKGDGNGRGHNATGFTMWMAGGGVKGGMRHGATDETGKTAVEGKMDTHDLHATILHLLGLDHEILTYKYAGRDFRLTDVHGRVAMEIVL